MYRIWSGGYQERKMQSMLMQTIRAHFVRACLVVGERTNQQMDTSIRDQIWEVMSADMDPFRPQPALTIREPVTPDRPTKPVEPNAPERPVKSEEDDAESVEDTKLSPQQRLEKQKKTITEKLDKIRARQGTAKQTAKQKENDPKELAKLEEKLKEVTTKLDKLVAKTSKPNFEKWTPTWTKHFKTAAGSTEVTAELKDDFVEFVNSKTPEQFKKFDILGIAKAYFEERNAAGTGLEPAPTEHVVSEPPKVERIDMEVDEDDDEDMHEVTYDGELYVVGEVTRKVYKATDEGDIPVTDLDTVQAVMKKLNL